MKDTSDKITAIIFGISGLIAVIMLALFGFDLIKIFAILITMAVAYLFNFLFRKAFPKKTMKERIASLKGEDDEDEVEEENSTLKNEEDSEEKIETKEAVEEDSFWK